MTYNIESQSINNIKEGIENLSNIRNGKFISR